MWRVRLFRVFCRNAGTAWRGVASVKIVDAAKRRLFRPTAWLEGRRFRFGEPSDIVAKLSKLMAEEEKQPRGFRVERLLLTHLDTQDSKQSESDQHVEQESDFQGLYERVSSW